MARDIHCVDCGTYLGEIRDAKLKKNISHICSSCTNIRKQHRTPDSQDTDFMSMFSEILKGKKYLNKDVDMNDKMRAVIDKVFEELKAMPREEFLKEFEKHAEGDIADILMECGAIEYQLKNLIDSETGKRPIIKLYDIDQVKGFIEIGRAGREAGKVFKEMFGDKSG